MLWLGVGFGSSLAAGLLLGPFNGALLLLTIAGIGVIFEHMFANIGLTIYANRQRQFDIFKHGVVPTVSSILGVIVLYYSMQGLLSTVISSPSLLNYAFLGAGIFGIVWPLAIGFPLGIYYLKKHPEKLAKAGEYDIAMEIRPQSKET